MIGNSGLETIGTQKKYGKLSAIQNLQFNKINQ